jgi:3-methyladenine DNA glycosylase AlkD
MKNNIPQFIKQRLLALDNKENAQAMAAYMKTSMPFYGVKAPDRRPLAKEAIKAYPIQNQNEFLQVVEELWNQSHREEKYIAIDIARSHPQYVNPAAFSLFEKMIRDGAWWDFVDDIAIHLIGTILMKYPSAIWPILEKWSNDSNLWIRRTVIICQNKFKKKTDQKRLLFFCLQRSHEKEFFIKKAIGWALREYARTEPQMIYEFIEKNKEHLSRLSYKEAVKNRAIKF